MHSHKKSTTPAVSAPTTTAEALRMLSRAVAPQAHLTLEAGPSEMPQLVFHACGVDLILPLAGAAPARPASVALKPGILPDALCGLRGSCGVRIARGTLTLRDANSTVTLVGRHTQPQRARRRPPAGEDWRVHPSALRMLARLSRGSPDHDDGPAVARTLDPLALTLHTAHGPVLAELVVLGGARLRHAEPRDSLSARASGGGR